MVEGIYIPRSAERAVLERLSFFPAVVLIGPRQVGKTSLTQVIRNQVEDISIYLDLERPRDLQSIDDLETFADLHRDHLIILDEIQHKPSLFPELRSVIDRYRRPGRFILLGSASLTLIWDSSESLAGRISIVELGGLTNKEIEGYQDFRTHWLRGGFPKALLSPTDNLSSLWRADFIRTYLERDLRNLGLVANPILVNRLLTMLAHLSGQTLNKQHLSNSLDLNIRTLNRYLDLLEQAFLIRRLPPYFVNIGKRLVKSPKFYVRDTGIIHQLLGITTQDDLLRHPQIGASFEAYIVEQVFSLKPLNTELYFYRTQGKAEIDIVVQRSMDTIAVAEIKYSVSPTLGKGFYSVIEDLKPWRKFVVTPTEEEPYQLKEGVMVIGPGHLSKLFE